VSLRKVLLATFLFSASSGLAMAQNLDMNLGDKSASFRYNAFVGGSTLGRTELNFGVLYNEDKNRYADVGLLVVDTAGSKAPGLEVGIGPRVMFMWEDDHDAQGAVIALGGRLNYKPQQMKRLRLGLEGYFAPSITSFMDVDRAYHRLSQHPGLLQQGQRNTRHRSQRLFGYPAFLLTPAPRSKNGALNATVKACRDTTFPRVRRATHRPAPHPPCAGCGPFPAPCCRWSSHRQ